MSAAESLKGGHVRHGVLILAALCMPAQAGGPVTPEGSWISYGDSGGKPEAIIRIFSEGGELKGRVARLFDPPAMVCDLCPGEQRGRPLKGLEILWGFRREGDRWTGGHILDPESGDTYRARMTLAKDGTRLEVCGYVGLPLLGRTQTWVRAGSEPND